MSREGWIGVPEGDQEPRERLPRVEDLPRAEHGYERAAVEAAFDAFYRHAARLDATLRTLEAVDAFQRQAGELREEIRALRAASWGPLPARQAWSAGYSVRSVSRSGGAVAEVLPRLAVEAALILLVAVGAALADLSTAWIVLLVLAAWFVVGLSEVAASSGVRPAVKRPVRESGPGEGVPGEPGGSPVAEEAAVDEGSAAEEPAARRLRGRFWGRPPTEVVEAREAEQAAEESAEAGEDTGELEAAAKPPVRVSGPGEGAPGEPAAQPPVRDSGPVEGVSGEPGGSPEAEEVAPQVEAAEDTGELEDVVELEPQPARRDERLLRRRRGRR